MKRILIWVGNASPSSPANSRPPTKAWSSRYHLLPCAQSLPRISLPIKGGKTKRLSDPNQPHTNGLSDRSHWKNKGGIKTPEEGARQLILASSGEPLGTGLFPSAWYGAQQLLWLDTWQLIVVSSDITALLTGCSMIVRATWVTTTLRQCQTSGPILDAFPLHMEVIRKIQTRSW